MITQKMLDRYYRLAAREREINQKRRELRETLLAMLDFGDEVQPGRLEAVVRTYKYRQLTREHLIDVFGEEYYEELRAEVEPEQRVQLQVIEKQEKKKKK